MSPQDVTSKQEDYTPAGPLLSWPVNMAVVSANGSPERGCGGHVDWVVYTGELLW